MTPRRIPKGFQDAAQRPQDYGFEAHLVHPLRCKAIASARLKNDKGRRRDLGADAVGALDPRVLSVRGGRHGSMERAHALSLGASGSIAVVVLSSRKPPD